MKSLTIFLLAAVLSFTFLNLPSILEARGGHGGGGHGGGFHGGGFHGGGFHRGHHGGFHGKVFFGFGLGFWPYVDWPYASYAGWPYYPSEVIETPPPHEEPEQQQRPSYFWYYCMNQGFYPYVKSCPDGWIPVVPNVGSPHQ